MNFTEKVLKKCMPAATDANVELFTVPLVNAMARYQISESNRRMAAFLAQVAHESACLKYTSENLNYSATGLLKVFGKYFSPDQAQQYARNPEMIANRVYANRMGNGPEESGDGWKYRGRGLIQLTGRDNYELLSHALGVDFIKDPDLLEKPAAAALSAGWYWHTNGLNTIADIDGFERITRKINGGLNGLADRKEQWARCRQALHVVI